VVFVLFCVVFWCVGVCFLLGWVVVVVCGGVVFWEVPVSLRAYFCFVGFVCLGCLVVFGFVGLVF
jgi:hypothetical protein